MSFSAEVKEELAARVGAARHCRLAELQAIWRAQEGRLDGTALWLKPAPASASGKFFTILQKTFNIDADGPAEICRAVETFAVRSACCRHAFLRGMFLCAGTVNDPSKSYHLEIVCRDSALADEVGGMLREEGLKAGETERNGRTVVYLKDGDDIVQLLGFMEAGRALLKMENERVTRDVRGNVNRRVNLETANIGKAVDAAARQIEAIDWLMNHIGTEDMPASLREMAQVRLAHPEATLAELGELLQPPVGKSGVNHRLRRLVGLAKEKGFDR